MTIDPMRRWWDTVVPSPIPGETRLQKMRREKAERENERRIAAGEPTLEEEETAALTAEDARERAAEKAKEKVGDILDRLNIERLR
jgi:hypothetical protein